MDVTSAHSVDNTPTGWDTFSVPKQPPRHAESTWARLPLPTATGHLAVPTHERRANASSATWTSSSGDLADFSDTDDLEVRDEFVREYNRIARKHGIRMLPSNTNSPSLPGQSPLQQRPGWFSRTFLRQPSTASDASSTKSEKKIKTKRSISDLALRVVNGAKKDSLQDEDLQSLVRLCGKSKLYLPSEYSPCSLVLPTCFRATAQYLVQHGAETRGVFRIPGSVRLVNALYAHYCADGDPDNVSSTICCPSLPTHIKTGPHDVASTFKRLLSGLPGGILGSLSLFDALVAIHSELKGEPEFLKTKQTKLRARLIALAVGTVKSRLRRDLICAVFGLLCLIGRAAEKAPREDEHGRPLPTSDLMGYNALGIVFGPLLVGDLLTLYTMQVGNTAPGPTLFPAISPNAKKERRGSKAMEDAQPSSSAVDKVYMANNITEMLITHWREVVRQMRSLGVSKADGDEPQRRAGLRPSVSEGFALKMPHPNSDLSRTGESPVPPSPTPPESMRSGNENLRPPLILPRRRPRSMRPLSSSLAGVEASLLSPPVEEPSPAEHSRLRGLDGAESRQSHRPLGSYSAGKSRETPQTPNRKPEGFIDYSRDATTPTSQAARRDESNAQERGHSSRLAIGPGSPNTPGILHRWQNVENRLRATSRGANPFKRNPGKDSAVSEATHHGQGETGIKKTLGKRVSQDTLPSTLRGSFENDDVLGDKPKVDVFGLGRSRLAAWRSKRKSLVSTGTGSPVPTHSHPREVSGERTGPESSKGLLSNHRKIEPRPSPTTGYQGRLVQGHGGFSEKYIGNNAARGDVPTVLDGHRSNRECPMDGSSAKSSPGSGCVKQTRPFRVLSGNDMARKQSLEEGSQSGTGTFQEGSSRDGDKRPSHSRPHRAFPLGPRPDPGRLSMDTIPQAKPEKPDGRAVKAMAAMFESAVKDLHSLPPSTESLASQVDARSSGMISPYTVNPSPIKSPRPTDSITIDRHTWASTAQDRRSRVAGRGEVSRSNIPIPSKHREPRPPARARTPKQSSAVSPGSVVESSLEVRESLLLMTPGTAQHIHQQQQPSVIISAPAPESQSPPNQTTPTPSPRLLKFTNDQPGDHHSPSGQRDDPSPASTTRRFPLLPTPEQRHRTASKSSTSTPAQDTPTTSTPSPSRRLFHPASLNSNSTTTAHTTTTAAAVKTNRIPSTDRDHTDNYEHSPTRDRTSRPDPGPGPGPGLWAGTTGAATATAAAAAEHLAAGLAAELAAAKARLCRVEQECMAWRARAEHAERRVRMLEGRGGGGGGAEEETVFSGGGCAGPGAGFGARSGGVGSGGVGSGGVGSGVVGYGAGPGFKFRSGSGSGSGA